MSEIGSERSEVHIITCGISSIVQTTRRLQFLSNPKIPLTEEELNLLSNYGRVRDAFLNLTEEKKRFLEEKLLEFLKSEPKKISAEMNSFLTYLGEHHPRIEHVHLIVSDTEEGKFAARVLERYLEERGYDVDKHIIRGFGSGDLETALEDLKEKVRSILKMYEGRLSRIFGSIRMVLNLTGGLKGEIASLAVLAAENGLKAYYIPEGADRVTILPTSYEVKIRATKWEKTSAVVQSLIEVLGILASLPLISLLNYSFIATSIVLLIISLWITLRKV